MDSEIEAGEGEETVVDPEDEEEVAVPLGVVVELRGVEEVEQEEAPRSSSYETRLLLRSLSVNPNPSRNPIATLVCLLPVEKKIC